jgi:mannose-6-phosphate isomerase-like protein (cupin superfamily)
VQASKAGLAAPLHRTFDASPTRALTGQRDVAIRASHATAAQVETPVGVHVELLLVWTARAPGRRDRACGRIVDHDRDQLANMAWRDSRVDPAVQVATSAEAEAAFPQLAPFGRGGIYAGRFVAQTPWERHPRGDEFLYVLAGEVEVTVLGEAAPRPLILRAGSAFVVPRGRWHRQHARSMVALLTATPTPSDISFASDPRVGT